MEESNSKSQRTTRLTMQNRLDILRCLELGETVASLSVQYGVSRSAIYKMKNSKENILTNAEIITDSNGSLKRKRAPTVEQSELDKELYSWFQQKRNRGDPISGPLLKEKALQLNEKLQGPSSFQATDGYIQKFKARHGIHFICGTFETLQQISPHVQDVTTPETREWLTEESADHDWPLLSDEETLSPDDETILDEDSEPQNQDEADDDEPTALEALRGLEKFQTWFQKRWDFTLEDWTKILLYRDTAIDVALNEKFPDRVIE